MVIVATDWGGVSTQLKSGTRVIKGVFDSSSLCTWAAPNPSKIPYLGGQFLVEGNFWLGLFRSRLVLSADRASALRQPTTNRTSSTALQRENRTRHEGNWARARYETLYLSFIRPSLSDWSSLIHQEPGKLPHLGQPGKALHHGLHHWFCTQLDEPG
jgi:hypothetical protein